MYKSEEYQTSNRGNKGRDSAPACNVNGMPKDRMMDVDDDDDEPPQRGARLSGPEGYMDWLDSAQQCNHSSWTGMESDYRRNVIEIFIKIWQCSFEELGVRNDV